VDSGDRSVHCYRKHHLRRLPATKWVRETRRSAVGGRDGYRVGSGRSENWDCPPYPRKTCGHDLNVFPDYELKLVEGAWASANRCFLEVSILTVRCKPSLASSE
jgi:hypothetical protein